METVTDVGNILKDLRRRATELTGAGVALVGLLADEASRLRRKDDVSRLRALHSSVSHEFEEAKRSEASSRYAYDRARSKILLAGVAGRVIVRLASKNESARTLVDCVADDLGGEERPFGTVLVYVGPKGLPDDVGVVSVSQLARESKREESEIIDQLKRGGCLLATEASFSLLIHRLIGDAEEGRLLLSVSTEKLSRLTEPPRSKPEVGKPAWVLLYWL